MKRQCGITIQFLFIKRYIVYVYDAMRMFHIETFTWKDNAKNTIYDAMRLFHVENKHEKTMQKIQFIIHKIHIVYVYDTTQVSRWKLTLYEHRGRDTKNGCHIRTPFVHGRFDASSVNWNVNIRRTKVYNTIPSVGKIDLFALYGSGNATLTTRARAFWYENTI